MTFNKDFEFLLSKFAHELRNPLTSVYSSIQLIELQHPEVKDFKYWSNLSCDLEYMNNLIADLSSFSKSERLTLKEISLKSMLEQVSLSFAATIAESKVEYTSKLDASLPIIIGDEVKLKQVVLNVLRNAYEASFPDQKIYLEAFSDEENVTISIRDTGCGISKEHLSSIFEPFVTHKKDGTGLGLAICDHIIKAHYGRISVDSKIGVGTCFTLTLPRTNTVLLASFAAQSEKQ